MWFSVFIILTLLVASVNIILLTFHYTTSGRKYWYFKKVPYKEPCPIFGNFGATFTMRRSYTMMLQQFYDKYNDQKFVGLFQARRPTLMVIDLDIVKWILVKEFSCFTDRISVSTDTEREPLIRNLANMSGADWKAMRHVVTPTFSSAKMKAMFPLIIECTQSLRNLLLTESLDEVDVPNIMGRFTTDVIGSCAFGVNPGSLPNPNSPFLKISQKMFKADRTTILKRYCRTFFPKLFKFLNLKSYSKDVEAFFTSIISQVLEDRRAKKTKRPDFLQSMLDVQQIQGPITMTDELILSNSFIFMLAGLETSAITLSFCLYELSKKNELQESLRIEVREAISRHGGLNYEAVCGMSLLIRVVLETLRLHPPTPLTTRICTTPCILKDTKLELKVKDPVLIPIHSIQRDEKHFPNPDKFEPDRFREDLNPVGFLAFGEGPRSCPGARFAQLIIATGLAAILNTFSVEPCPRTTERIHYDPRSVMLKNIGGIWLKFKAL